MESVVIDPQGDVCFVLEKKDEEKSKIGFVVNSHVLRLASEVFAALLGPNFREGNALARATTPLEIALPEDDADGIKWLFEVLHHRSRVTPPRYTTDVMLAVARAVDKYRCQDAFCPTAQIWLQGWLNGEGADEDMVTLLGLAIAFGSSESIMVVVLDLAITTGSKVNAATTAQRVMSSPLCSLIPDAVCKGIDTYRRSLHNRFNSALLGLMRPLQEVRPSTNSKHVQDGMEHDDAASFAFIRHICRLHMLPEDEEDDTPLLIRCFALQSLAVNMKRDPLLHDKFSKYDMTCRACVFMKLLSTKLFDVFLDVGGSQEGKTLQQLVNGDTQYNEEEKYYKYGEARLSPAFNTLFNWHCTVGNFSAHESLLDLRDELEGVLGFAV